jgi:hypothetical protein
MATMYKRRNASVRIIFLVYIVFLIFPCLAEPQREQLIADSEILAAKFAGEASVEVELPKLKLGKKDKPLDEQVRVGLYLSSQLGRDPRVYSVDLDLPKWEELDRQKLVEIGTLHLSERRVRIATLAQAKATLLTVHLSKPLSARLAEIVRSLFPHTAIRFPLYAAGEAPLRAQPERPDSPACTNEEGTALSADDLRIQVEMIPHLVERGKPIHVLEKLIVEVKLTISDAAQRAVEVIDVAGAADIDGFTFNPISPWEDEGQEALRQVSDKLVEALRQSQRLNNCLKKFAEPRSLPAGLVIAAKLDDTASLFPNGRLDAGEEARLSVHIENKGPGPAYRVGVQTSSDRPEITVAGESALGDLDPGAKKDVVLRVAGGLGLSTGLAKLRVEAVEKRGYGSRPVELEIGTNQILPPKLEIVDVTLNDRSGRAVGDGDGQPGNGESIEAVVRVHNAGPGDGAGVVVTMESPKVAAVEVLDSKVILPRIPAGRVEEARLLFRLPFTLEAQELPLLFQAADARGAQVGSATKDQKWKIRTKRPGIVLRTSYYDGESAGSIGNRNHEANNGERIEVVVTPENNGELAARGVRIAVETADSHLTPRPAVLEVGDLPPKAEGAAQRFILDIPREYGLDRAAGDMHLTFKVSQQDFPPRREAAVPSLRFRPLRPQLTLEPVIPSLTRNSQGEMFLHLRNAGELRAEDVVMEVTSEVAGVDLLDERRVPGHSRRFAVGALDSQAAAPPASAPIRIRQSVAPGTVQLHITVTQKGFPAMVREVPLAVAEEMAEKIPFKPAEEPMPAEAPLGPIAPATIFFLNHREGEHLLEKAVDLRFEVLSQVELSDTRLSRLALTTGLVERQISLDSAEVARISTPGLHRETYRLSVPLEDGENQFRVVVVTQQGKTSIGSLTLFRDHDKGNVWVVAIGISKYQDPAIKSLQYADADARAVYDFFRLKLGPSQVFLLVNEEATLREIKSILGTKLVAKAWDTKDTVILYSRAMASGIL